MAASAEVDAEVLVRERLPSSSPNTSPMELFNVLRGLKSSSKGRLRHDCDWKPTNEAFNKTSKLSLLSPNLSNTSLSSISSTKSDLEDEKGKNVKDAELLEKELQASFDSTHVAMQHYEDEKSCESQERLNSIKEKFAENSKKLLEEKNHYLQQKENERVNEFIRSVQAIQQDEKRKSEEARLRQQKLEQSHQEYKERALRKVKEVEELRLQVLKQEQQIKKELQQLEVSCKSIKETALIIQQTFQECKFKSMLSASVSETLSEMDKVLLVSQSSLDSACENGRVSEMNVKIMQDCSTLIQSLFQKAKSLVHEANTCSKAVKEEAERQAKEEARTKEEEEKRQQAAKASKEKQNNQTSTSLGQSPVSSAQSKSGLSKELSSCISGTAWTGYSRQASYKSEVVKAAEPLNTDKSLKQNKFDLHEAVTTPINAISDQSPSHLLDKIQPQTKPLSGHSVQMGGKQISIAKHPAAKAPSMPVMPSGVPAFQNVVMPTGQPVGYLSCDMLGLPTSYSPQQTQQNITQSVANAGSTYRGKYPEEDLQSQVREMEQQLTNVQGQLQEKELQLANLHEQLRAREQQLTHFQRQLQEKELQEADLHEQLRERELHEKNLRRQLRQTEQQLVSSQRLVREWEQRLTHFQSQLGQQLREKEQQVENSQVRLREMEQQLQKEKVQVSDLERQLRDRDQDLVELNKTLSEADKKREEYQHQETHDWIIPRDEIIITDKQLGRGGWGYVMEGKYCGCAVAVKKLFEEVVFSPYNQRKFEREMNIASKCRHPCLLQFIGATNDEKRPLFVTELMESSLRQLLKQGPLSATEVLTISLDGARALSYLHQKKPIPILHRDVSSANVLLWRRNDEWRAKVSDYGTANFLQDTMTAGAGAMIYSAPEAFTPDRQTVKVDVYSYGVLLCEMCIRELPDPDRSDQQIAMVTNDVLRALIRRCVQTEPEARPSMEEIIEDLQRTV